MSKKNIDQLVTMAKAAAKQSAENGGDTNNSPEMMEAIQSASMRINATAPKATGHRPVFLLQANAT